MGAAKGFDSSARSDPGSRPTSTRPTCRCGPADGTLEQDGKTGLMIFDVPTVISYITSFMTLLPGEVVLTGTPAGVGPMVAGDDVSVTVEGIGTLTNKVVSRD